jgi:hypothetical protein
MGQNASKQLSSKTKSLFACLKTEFGTSHISELRPDKDLVAFLDVGRLGLINEIDMLVDGGAGEHVRQIIGISKP